MIATFVVDGEHSFLSNFFESEILLPWDPDHVAKSAEHLYQSMKATNPADADFVLSAPTPAEAKKRGRRIEQHPNWDALKIPAMRATLNLKFAVGQPESARLLQTADQYLAEGNDWGDTFWGVVDGQGDNWLGVLLMARRAELRGMR